MLILMARYVVVLVNIWTDRNASGAAWMVNSEEANTTPLCDRTAIIYRYSHSH